MNQRPLLLVTFAALTLTLPALGQSGGIEPVRPMSSNDHPSFEVASIMPSDPNNTGGGFHLSGHQIFIENQTVHSLLQFAYTLHDKQIVDEPSWLPTEKFDIRGVPDVEGAPNLLQYQEMVQRLLADRFGLKFHRDQREIPVYALQIAKGGPKLTASTGRLDGAEDQTGHKHGSEETIRFTNNTMANLALGLQDLVDRPVVDQTRLTGRFDFALTWTPDETAQTDANAAPGLFTAIQEQLGLKLEPQKTAADVLVIDHIERPTKN